MGIFKSKQRKFEYNMRLNEVDATEVKDYILLTGLNYLLELVIIGTRIG